jgi:hypothetical protein
MKSLSVLLVLVALALPALAQSGDTPRFSGYIWKGHNDTAYVMVRPQSNVESWWFEIPSGSYFWCKTYNADGDELEDTDLSDHTSITLLGAKGERVKFAIYEVAGGGEWSARLGSERGSANDDVTLGEVSTPSEEPAQEQGASGSSVEPGGLVASGTLSDGESSTFSYTADSDSEDIVFTWPEEATFHVKIYNRSGSLLHDYDLADGNGITMTGGGTFSFKVYCTDGGGDWTARRAE